MPDHFHPLAFVQRSGTGGPLVFVHAVGFDLTWWDTVLAELDPQQSFVAFDLPGHGLSPALEGEFSIEHLAEIVFQNLVRLGLDRFHLCGHSVGGMIGQALALAHPQAVISLTLVATAATYDPAVRQALRARASDIDANGMAPLVQPTLDRWFTPAFRAQRPDVIARCERTLAAADPLVQARMWRAIAKLDFLNGLSTLAVPTQVIAGEIDKATPLSGAKLMAEHMLDAQLLIIPGSGHLATVEASDRIAHALKNFTTPEA